MIVAIFHCIPSLPLIFQHLFCLFIRLVLDPILLCGSQSALYSSIIIPFVFYLPSHILIFLLPLGIFSILHPFLFCTTNKQNK